MIYVTKVNKVNNHQLIYNHLIIKVNKIIIKLVNYNNKNKNKNNKQNNNKINNRFKINKNNKNNIKKK